MLNFIIEHWVIVSLILSELLAFIPAKYNGIAQICFKVVNLIFQKKENTAIKAQNRKFYN